MLWMENNDYDTVEQLFALLPHSKGLNLPAGRAFLCGASMLSLRLHGFSLRASSHNPKTSM